MVRKHGQPRVPIDDSSESDQEENDSIRQTRQQSQKTQQKQPQKSSKPSTSRQQHQNTQEPQSSRQKEQPQPKGNNSGRRKQQNPQPNRKRGAGVLHDIVRLQTTVNNLIPKLPFGRVVREILQSHGDFRVTMEAFQVFHESAEIYLVQLLDDASKLTLHRNRATLVPGDIRLVLYLRGRNDPGSTY